MELTTLELSREYMEFSAGHFTIFSESRREKMHGHNFTVHAAITTEVTENGIAFDYMIYKTKILKLCQKLNGYFLLPSKSPYFKIEEQPDHYRCYFNQEKMIFPKSDIIILPLRNITVEELAKWFLEQLTTDKSEILAHRIHAMTIKIYSSPAQSGAISWKRES